MGGHAYDLERRRRIVVSGGMMPLTGDIQEQAPPGSGVYKVIGLRGYLIDPAAPLDGQILIVREVAPGVFQYKLEYPMGGIPIDNTTPPTDGQVLIYQTMPAPPMYRPAYPLGQPMAYSPPPVDQQVPMYDAGAMPAPVYRPQYPIGYPVNPMVAPAPTRLLTAYEPSPGVFVYQPANLDESQARIALASATAPIDVNNQVIQTLADPTSNAPAHYQQAANSRFAQEQRSGSEIVMASLNDSGVWYPNEYIGPNCSSSSQPNIIGVFPGNTAGYWQAPCDGDIHSILWSNPCPPFSPIDAHLYLSIGGPGGFFFTGITMQMLGGAYMAEALFVPYISVNKYDCLVWYNPSLSVSYSPGSLRIFGQFAPRMLTL